MRQQFLYEQKFIPEGIYIELTNNYIFYVTFLISFSSDKKLSLLYDPFLEVSNVF